MLNFFKKTNDNKIYAPVKGKCIDISNVNDEVFSKKMMGDGVAIIPIDNIIKAPADGKLTMLFDTGHAIGMKMDNGLEILIHIGIDTVNENGKGFEVLKKTGEYFKHGEPIVKIDLDYLKSKYDMSTMVVVTNKEKVLKLNLNRDVDENSPILERG